MKVVLTCGPWGSGTTAVAGLLARIGAYDFDPYFHFTTNDPDTPDSHEFMPFRDIILQYADQPTVALKPAPPGAVKASLLALRQQIERQQFGRYDIRRSRWISLKYPLSALLIPEICEVFETKLVYVMRPLEQIERSRLRRNWPPYFGAMGAEVIYGIMSEVRKHYAYPTMTVEYAALLAAPLHHARQFARFVGLAPTRAELRQAAAFVTPRSHQVFSGR